MSGAYFLTRKEFQGRINEFFTPPDCVHYNPGRSGHRDLEWLDGEDENPSPVYLVGCRLINIQGPGGIFNPNTKKCGTSCKKYEKLPER